MSDHDPYTRGFSADIEAERAAADAMAYQVESAVRRNREVSEAATAGKAAAAEHRHIMEATRQALASALTTWEARA